jgi:hypothetical protein
MMLLAQSPYKFLKGQFIDVRGTLALAERAEAVTAEALSCIISSIFIPSISILLRCVYLRL